jgi:threonylcarbamoyladenosine tRNA methylthiotransferase MtaB
MASTFHVEHFGCRAARADGEAVSGRLRAAGLCERQFSAADVVVVNTCSVTAEADRAARAFIRRAHRLNPEARIVVTGCYAQRAPEELASLAGVAAVVGNSHKALAPEIILNLARAATPGFSPEIDAAEKLDSGPQLGQPPTGPAGLPGVEQDALALYQAAALAVPQISHKEPRALAPEGHSSGAPQEIELPFATPAHFVGVASLPATRTAGPAPIWADDRFAHSFLEEAQIVPGAQTRPNLKIQEGCGNRCTFCVIPQTRGSSRSLPAASVLQQVEGFVAAGGNELVLSGINLGRWGRDLTEPLPDGAGVGSWLPTLSAEESGKDGARRFDAGPGGSPRTLAGLVRQIFERTALARLRLSSIEPMDWDGELIGLMAEFGGGRLARHAHLPLQSGSDAVLRRMHRRYRPWHYAEKVAALIRAAGPELTLGADVMAGFPGETDAEFEETLALIEALPFGYLHLFPFSPRPGTPGWALHAERPVPAEAVEERMAALRAVAAEKSKTHRRWFVGRELEAITLHTPAEMDARARTAALTGNFLAVELEGRLAANRLVRLRVTGLNGEGTLEATAQPSPNARGFTPHSSNCEAPVAV